MSDDGDPLLHEQHIVAELGFHLYRVGAQFHGSATVVPEMYVPGTKLVRTSVFASWTDLATGYLAVDAFEVDGSKHYVVATGDTPQGARNPVADAEGNAYEADAANGRLLVFPHPQ